ncbi:hypothetical protein CK203_015978 [Vitis vinifera]|uniref:Uncharacterized protein n=1 Tax=Vitis vinifera TaxID=29760 RepID=A0A438JR83_VITVI|nr:hypothetical protein CK203_015978 [Vitis vinifera]
MQLAMARASHLAFAIQENPTFKSLPKSSQEINKCISMDGDHMPYHVLAQLKGYLLSPLVLVSPMSGRPLLLYLLVLSMALGCMLAQLDDSGKERAIYYLSKRMLEYEMRYVMIDHLYLVLVWATRRSRHYMIEYLVCLISQLDPLRSVRLVFSDRHPITNNIVEYEACILGLETTLELSIRQMKVFGDSNLVLRHIQGDWKTRDVKLRSYHAYLELLVRRFDDLRYTHQPRVQNQFVDVLATLASSVDFLTEVVICPLLIESRFAPAYCCLVGDTEVQDDLPWYHDIY